MQFTLVGLASKTQKELTVGRSDLEQSLLQFLRSHKVAIASSCDGEGICKKCATSNNIILCSITVEKYFEIYGNIIKISYL